MEDDCWVGRGEFGCKQEWRMTAGQRGESLTTKSVSNQIFIFFDVPLICYKFEHFAMKKSISEFATERSLLISFEYAKIIAISFFVSKIKRKRWFLDYF